MVATLEIMLTLIEQLAQEAGRGAKLRTFFMCAIFLTSICGARESSLFQRQRFT